MSAHSQKALPSISLGELATLTQSELVGQDKTLIYGVNDLETATEQQAAFLENPKYANALKTTNAGVIFIHPKAHSQAPLGPNYLLNAHPSLAFQKAIEFFIQRPPSGFEAIHPTAVVHENVSLGVEVRIGPGAIIEQGVTIGDRTCIDAGVYIGAETVIGNDCHLWPRAVVRERCVLKNRVVLQPGAVIGSSGYGYFTDEKGIHHPLEQLGIVVLEDDVEIGANSTIDRARFKTTLIGKGTKIDNLVQIAHQVEVGKHCLIVAQVGIAGSTKIGNHVVMGGQCGITGHITIADRVMLAAKTGVTKTIEEPGGAYAGAPAMKLRECYEQVALMRILLRNHKKNKTPDAIS